METRAVQSASIDKQEKTRRRTTRTSTLGLHSKSLHSRPRELTLDGPSRGVTKLIFMVIALNHWTAAARDSVGSPRIGALREVVTCDLVEVGGMLLN